MSSAMFRRGMHRAREDANPEYAPLLMASQIFSFQASDPCMTPFPQLRPSVRHWRVLNRQLVLPRFRAAE